MTNVTIYGKTNKKNHFVKIDSKEENLIVNTIFKAMQLLSFKAADHKRYYLSEYQYLPIKIPRLEEQNRIINILSKADKEIELIEQELEQYKQLKKALSQLLLTGIVRVNEV